MAILLRADDRFARIIVICTRQIGDVLLTTPLIAAAKERWPEARIDVLGFGGTLGMLRGNPDVAELIVADIARHASLLAPAAAPAAPDPGDQMPRELLAARDDPSWSPATSGCCATAHARSRDSAEAFLAAA